MRNSRPLLDITGMKFGKLTAILFSHKANNAHYWLTHCSCGELKVAMKGNLINGNTKSCGCLPYGNSKHGHMIAGKASPTYKSWTGMKDRCYSTNHISYKNYGGRGITVCDRWLHSFDNFLHDMGVAPKKHSIDRIDNNGNYTKNNCRWATRLQQNYNRRSWGISKYRGVSKRNNGKWICRVSINKNKIKHVGYFNSEIEAAKAYNAYVIQNNIHRKINTFGDKNG